MFDHVINALPEGVCIQYKYEPHVSYRNHFHSAMSKALALVLVLVAVTSAFHLQSDPNVIRQVCTYEWRYFCQRQGMTCRAFQQFDASIPRPRCEYPWQRRGGW
ncbi:uncharacterized protein LOC128157249 [Crassostrea angulata]|nr:uncharacterized protein LOC105332758 [Crassostrea gigas]XP_052675668.1 uncharacterized protein LOC128157249 [Crassostrea angulata]|eukprot:XP_019924678.1 PREDICTED: uncharacterized protein LOC105332758 [Crassostrea gigas]